MADLNEIDSGLTPEEVPSNVDLRDLDDESSGGGAWPKAWYPAEIIEGYLAGSFQWTTQDVESNKGGSRNLRLCFRVKNGTEERSTFVSYNYRPEDFSAQRIEAVKRARKEFAPLGRQSWPGHKDVQASSIAISKLGRLHNATGVAPQFHPETKGVIAGLYVGKKVDVYLSVDENGYNKVTSLEKLGEGGKPKKKAATK